MLAGPRRSIHCGQVRVAFAVRKNLEAVQVQAINTLRGTITVATPESTAVDLIGYPQRVGGLDQMVAVLADLADRIDGSLLPIAAASAPVAWAQRLGYLLDWLGEEGKTEPLRDYVQANAREIIPLQPGRSWDERVDAPRNTRWKIRINAQPEADQ
jgi:predicted transcriptional regulator of viral defense system